VNLDYVVLVVGDLDRSLAFYTEAIGFELDHRSGPYAQLATGTTRLGLFERDAMAQVLGDALEPPEPHRPGFEIGCKVADCDAAFAQTTNRGAEPVVEPANRPWGQRTAYVRDPDGHLVELAQDGTDSDGSSG